MRSLIDLLGERYSYLDWQVPRDASIAPGLLRHEVLWPLTSKMNSALADIVLPA